MNFTNDIEVIVIDDKVDEEHEYQISDISNYFMFNYCITKGAYPPVSALEPLARQINLMWKSKSFYEQLKKCNFYKKAINDSIYMIENPTISFARHHYLNELKETKKQVYYLEARLVDNLLTFGRCWDKIDLSTENKLVYMSACSSAGFVTGVFLNEFKEDVLVNWVSNVLLTFIQDASVIVFDHAPCLSVPINIVPTKFDSKVTMCKWLENNNVPHSSNMRKHELFYLIEKFKHKTSVEYKIDEVIKAHGHEVLHLPKHMRNSTPFTFLWDQVRADITKFEERQRRLPTLADTVSNIVSNKTKEFWSKAFETVKSKESCMYLMDLEIESQLDKVIDAS